ncbi:bifunctional 4-hydroxy-2-oxoglutarate aldolase/2-dehydro-3-deoxy-phosphogluconate aldolase [Rhodococcus sp. IEGM 1381]|uniref:bifunctional 4-hydroxy-2-oxoglutarate aldolase/2-dehydro-3-deoxy-phosphogluconate aldolase n=1 Tax=Rhodococcus sp. IEGM 1381 TaxID=3047085 RepID=UPI0024B854E6|nr:bifunctional 4-hydroxy-2-oxoglutarate aldolase/2-dehydro-3-deoxy-phosphogluconate aldolase [Rhodococcus sp. IEGM 1381]MDI9894143.1 bifunctional 4-hydroxy-2-oxoglutarate aldolase/2-dehydro-3-deoxy-phosphogluconate aldolase [Rhodococcus sp. IEGM 1381]
MTSEPTTSVESLTARDVLRVSPVIPVVVIDRVEDAVPLARALYAGGIGIIEMTLRSEAALGAIAAIAANVPEVVIGAGTVLTREDALRSVDAGSRFLVSPGSPKGLLDAARALPVPLLAGVSTATEAMTVAEGGSTEMKFFPAESSGGASALGALAGPLPHLTFCPTGGITPQNAVDYLALPNVVCVGGSWLTPRSLVQAGNWAVIEELARSASALSSA